MQNQTQFSTIQEVAELFKVSKTTILNWANPKSRHYLENFPKPYKLGSNTTRWKLAELQAYIDSLNA